MYTTDELRAIARRYYPAHLSNDDPRYFASEETQRRRAACAGASAEHERFAGLVEALRARHPERFVADETMLTHDPCLRVRMSTHPHDPGGTRWTFVVGCLSVIAPVYMVYVSETWAVGKGVDSRVTYAPTGETAAAYAELGGEMESRFGAERVPPEIGLTVLPDLQTGNVELGQATISDCIFTPDRR